VSFLTCTFGAQCRFRAKSYLHAVFWLFLHEENSWRLFHVILVSFGRMGHVWMWFTVHSQFGHGCRGVESIQRTPSPLSIFLTRSMRQNEPKWHRIIFTSFSYVEKVNVPISYEVSTKTNDQDVHRHKRIDTTHFETDCFKTIRNIRLKLLPNNRLEWRRTEAMSILRVWLLNWKKKIHETKSFYF